jgi:hypothetical protein
MYNAFMCVFCVLVLEILWGVIPCFTNEGVWLRGAAPEEFVCELVDELADWDHLEVGVKG